MRAFRVISAAGLAAAQLTSIVISDGITTTLVLPVWPDSTSTVVVTVPETTVTVGRPTVTPFTTLTLIDTTVLDSSLTTTVYVDPTAPVETISSTVTQTTTVTPGVTVSATTSITVVVPPVSSLTFTTTTFFTSSPNATTSRPAVVPTAAAEKVNLPGSVLGLIGFGVAGLLMW